MGEPDPALSVAGDLSNGSPPISYHFLILGPDGGVLTVRNGR